VRHLGAVQPYGISVVDFQNEHVACGSKAAPDGVGSRRLAGAGEGGSCDGVTAGSKGELDCVASSGGDGIWGKDESIFTDGDMVDV
jgi:hypothetical protein